MQSSSTDNDHYAGQQLTATATAYDTVREMLLSGELPGGSVVQERKLADQLGLSRTPMREALGRLEGEGLVRRDGRHLLVATVSVAEVMEILAVRRCVEAEAVRGAVDRMPRDRVDAIRSAVLGMVDLRSVSDDEHWSVDDLVHLSIADASGNRLLARIIRDLRQRTRMFGLRRIPTRFDSGKAEHLAILDAIAAGDSARAVSQMQGHLDNARDGILRIISGGASQ